MRFSGRASKATSSGVSTIVDSTAGSRLRESATKDDSDTGTQRREHPAYRSLQVAVQLPCFFSSLLQQRHAVSLRRNVKDCVSYALRETENLWRMAMSRRLPS